MFPLISFQLFRFFHHFQTFNVQLSPPLANFFFRFIHKVSFNLLNFTLSLLFCNLLSLFSPAFSLLRFTFNLLNLLASFVFKFMKNNKSIFSLEINLIKSIFQLKPNSPFSTLFKPTEKQKRMTSTVRLRSFFNNHQTIKNTIRIRERSRLEYQVIESSSKM